MKKIKKIAIFCLGITFGLLAYQLIVTYSTPSVVAQTTTIDISSVVNSLKDVVPQSSVSSLDYEKFERIKKLLDQQYYHITSGSHINEEEMLDAALRSYVEAVGDPYTTYFTIEQNSGFTSDLKGESDFEGIGAVVVKITEGIRIQELIKNWPAFQAGIKPLDIVVAVDDKPTLDLSVNEAVDLIKGPAGTDVTLTIVRDDTDGRQVFDLVVTRDAIVISSVNSRIESGDQGETLWYIDIAMVGEETERLFKENVAELLDQNIQWLVLDLRGNGGGLLDIATEILSHFIPSNQIVVTAKYSAYPEEVYRSKWYGELENLPVVVLMDSYTASAGEIIAGSLRETRGATLIGTTTFGKGSIQILRELDDGSGFKFTVGAWYLPSGDNVNGSGVVPDIEVEYSTGLFYDEWLDNQLQTAITELSRLVE